MVARKNTRRAAQKPPAPAPQSAELSEYLKEYALDLARGDVKRITVVTSTEVIIENHPKGTL